MAIKSDLQKAVEELTAKGTLYTALWGYYDGNHPLRYSTKRLQEVFKHVRVSFTQNWCAVVIDAVLDRLNLLRFDVAKDDTATQVLNDLYVSTGLKLDDDDIHTASLVTGEAFVIAWRSAEDKTEAYYNDPRLCHMFYDKENPHKPRLAAKWWSDEEGKKRLTLYYPDRLEYYISRRSAKQVRSYKAFIPMEEESAPNPFGVIPVFHFRREFRVTKSELENAIPPQDMINKLLADMMVTAEFGAFKQRVIISQEDPGNLKNAPYINWWIPSGDGTGQASSVHQLDATDLGGYLEAIDKQANALAAITRTPKHYFFSEGGTVPSGEALIAMEAPLNKKSTRYTERLSATWQRLGAFLLQLEGQTVTAQSIKAIYDDPRTVQPFTQAQVREASVRAGIPLRTVLRTEGWSEAQIDQMDADKKAEAAAAKTSLAEALLTAQRQFDQGGDDGE